MTNLKCAACNCSYNKNSLCSLNSINVDGMSASTSGGTCCKNFSNQTMSGCFNDVTVASPETNVGCKAEKCKHNQNCKCNAGSISVGGSNAHSKDETCCLAFKCK